MARANDFAQVRIVTPGKREALALLGYDLRFPELLRWTIFLGQDRLTWSNRGPILRVGRMIARFAVLSRTHCGKVLARVHHREREPMPLDRSAHPARRVFKPT